MTFRDERGFNLVEVLLVLVISLIILGATITTFTKLIRHEDSNNRRNQSAEQARNALDIEARQLRNLAQRITNPVIRKVDSYDFVFQTSDPTRTWVRYCLDTTLGTSKARLWETTWAVPVSNTSADVTASMTGTCPGTGWTTKTIASENVVNKIGGRDRPLFSFVCTDGTASCTAASSTYDQIVGVGSQLYVDTTADYAAPEQRVASSVYLRNQNQAPDAHFDVTSAGSRTVILNASGSSDYEGRTLAYYWFKGTIPTTAAVTCDAPTTALDASNRTILWGGVLIGTGVTLNYVFPAADGAAGASQDIALVACDPGGRSDFDGPRGVTIPS
jgi:prepilin-type N-terminal cleavage/methylation domain-containing protein